MIREILVKASIRLGCYDQLMKADTHIREWKMRRKFKKYGLETLVLADKTVSSFQGHMFLDFGTLLGAYRNKDFIPYDCDLDVGLAYTERQDNFPELMELAGFKLKRRFYIKENGIITEEQFEYKGVQIDFFYYFEETPNNKVYCYVGQKHESKDWRTANATDGFPAIQWVSDKTKLIRMPFLGQTFYVPQATDQWLSSLYGEDFMTPVKNWSAGNRKTGLRKAKERLYREQQ